MNTRDYNEMLGELSSMSEREIRLLALLVRVFCVWKWARPWVLGLAFVCAALVGFNPLMAFPALALAGLTVSPWPVMRATSLIFQLA